MINFRKYQNQLLFSFKIVIFLTVIYFLYSKFRLNEIEFSSINETNFIYIILIILSILFHILLSIYRWYHLIKIEISNINFKIIYDVGIFGYLSDQISFFGLLLSRSVLLKKISKKTIIVSTILEKSIALFVKVLITIPGIIFIFLKFDYYFNEYFFYFFIVLLFLLTFFFLVLKNKKIYSLIDNINVFKIYLLNYKILYLILLTIFIQFINIFCFVLIFLFLNIDLSYIEVLFLIPLAILLSSAQFLFGQIGIRELAFFIVFQFTTFSNSTIILASLIYSVLYICILLLLSVINTVYNQLN